jgi:hypothetical protein
VPDKFNIKKEYVEHDFWTAESIDFGRTKVTPYVAPPAPEPKPRGRKKSERLAENEEAPGVASENGADAVAELAAGGTMPLAEAAAPPAEAEAVAEVVEAAEGDDDWSFQPS